MDGTDTEIKSFDTSGEKFDADEESVSCLCSDKSETEFGEKTRTVS